MELFKVGYIYKTRSGNNFYVIGEHIKYRGYETVYNQFNKGRYNRTTHSVCNGRTTGSDWTENCLVYPPEVVSKINPFTFYTLKWFSQVYGVYQYLTRLIDRD